MSGPRVEANSLQGSTSSVRVHADSQYEDDPPAVDQDLDLAQLKVLRLTECNKRLLLGNAIKAAQDLLPETRAVFARLEQLHPPTAKELELKSLALSEAPFRLLSDLPESSHNESQIALDSFIALSYCWHSHEWNLAERLTKAKEWPISSAMMCALLDQRQSPSEGVWIDACCIDQDNAIEKTHAIGSMDIIYKSARLIVVVLEDVRIADSERDIFEKFLTKDEYHPQPNFPREELRTLSSILAQIHGARWFTRAWCSHELQLSSNSMYLLSTNKGILRFKPHDLTRLYQSSYSVIYDDEDLVRATKQIRYVQLALNRQAHHTRSLGGLPGEIMSQCDAVWQLDASIAMDKIGIVLNITGLQLYFKGPRRSHDECRWVLAMVALSAGDVTVLGGVDGALKLGSDTGARSWLHWSTGRVHTMAFDNTIVAEQCIERIHYDHIVLDLFVLEVIALHSASARSVHEATIFVDRCIANHIWSFGSCWMSYNPDSALFEVLRIWAIETIACSVDCGISWLMKQTPDSKVLALLSVHWQELWLFVRGLLTSRYPWESATIENLARKDTAALSAFFAGVLFNYHVLGRNSTSYSSGMYRDRDGHEILPQCMWVEIGGTARGITTMGSGEMKPYVLAIPVAMSGDSCARTRRLWLLRPFETASDGSWKIVEKRHFTTLETVTEEWAGIKRRNKQIIRGS